MIYQLSSGEPNLVGLRDVVGQVSEFAPEWIVAIGGGSAIDQGKMAWVLYEHPDLDTERAEIFGGIPPLRGKSRLSRSLQPQVVVLRSVQRQFSRMRQVRKNSGSLTSCCLILRY